MKVWTYILLFGLFAHTSSTLRINPKGDHRVVNLPHETDSAYSNEEYSGDTNKLLNVQNFIKRGTTLNNRNMKLGFRAPRVLTLTDFIQKAVHILNTYDDTAFEDFFYILDNEIRKYHYRGCKFSELMQNANTRSLLTGSLNLIRGKSVFFTKASINEVADMLRDETYDKNVEELLDYINSLYTNTELSFHKVLNELKYYKNTKSLRTHNNLEQVIRGGVQAVLFDPYTELNTHTRRELKKRIETFWKQFQNNTTSSADVNDIPNADPVIHSYKVSENVMAKVPENSKNPEDYSKNDFQAKSKNKRERTVSIENFGNQSQRDKSEQDESSDESGKQIKNYNTDAISSGQSFDSSSNSIKNSQERRVEYNTQRYMTLYTEEISYKAKTTKKTEIIPISENVLTRRPIIKKRRTTSSTPREKDVSSDTTEKIEMLRAYHNTNDTKLVISNSSHDINSGLTLESKHEPRARENYDKQQKHGKADESRSKSKQKNVEIISQYDAVIDVQLANTELLKSLGMFEPLRMDTNSRYDTTLYLKSDLQTELETTKSTIRPRSMRSQAEIIPQKSTAPTKSPSKYSKRNKPFHRSNIRKNIASPLPNEGHPDDQFMKDKNQNQEYLRRSGNDTIGAEDFNTYVIKRINAMENEIKELKQMKDFSIKTRMNENNTDMVEDRNVTDKIQAKNNVYSKRKDMKGNVIEGLNEHYDLNNEKVNAGHQFTKINYTINKASSTNNTKSRKLNVIKKANATVIDNKNTTQVTNNHTSATVNLVKITNATKLESVVTTHAPGITRRTMAYSEPSYYDFQQKNRPTVRNSQFDPFFDHINDGINLHM